MNVLIIGASGLVGGNCLTYFKQKGWHTIGTHVSYSTDATIYLDTTNISSEKNNLFNELDFVPDTIIHCGALTNVDYCEENQEESYNKTVVSAQNVLHYAKRHNSKVVYISTDYVFDGENGPYTELAETNPINIYGQHKLLAEQCIQQLASSLIIRVTNVFGEEQRGKNFVSRLINNTLSNKRLELPTDQYATPINALDIAKAVYLLVRDKQEGVYHLGSTDYVNRYQLAFRVKQFTPDSEIQLIPVKTHKLNQAANRPKQAGLLSIKFLSQYPDFTFTNIDDYLLRQQPENDYKHN